MTIEKLNKKVKDSGYKKKYLASKIGASEIDLYHALNGKRTGDTYMDIRKKLEKILK